MMSDNESLNKIQKRLKGLIFSLNEELHAVPISDIAEVNRIVNLKPAEGAPDWVLGLINLHGETTAVINLKRLLSIEPSNFSHEAMWLAVKKDKSFVCLAIDKVCRFIDLDPETLDEMPTLTEGPDLKYIKCYARLHDGPIPVLDVKAIVNKRKCSESTGLAGEKSE